MRILFLFLTYGLCSLKAQEIKIDLQNIRLEYSKTEKALSTYTQKTGEAFGLSTEGGMVTAYQNGEEIKKIKAELFGETGKSHFDMYYLNNELIFVLGTRHQYNRPIYWDSEIAKEYGDNQVFDEFKTEIEENRYYFKNNELIYWLGNEKKLIDTVKEVWSSKTKDLIAFSETLKATISEY